MATVLLFIDNKKPFKLIDREFQFTRVPSQGEIVSLGADENGLAADYEVVLVVHMPLQPKGRDAEVYLRRIDLSAEIMQRQEKGDPGSGYWKAGSRPVFADETAQPS
jgi:hypothetical protein